LQGFAFVPEALPVAGAGRLCAAIRSANGKQTIRPALPANNANLVNLRQYQPLSFQSEQLYPSRLQQPTIP